MEWPSEIDVNIDLFLMRSEWNYVFSVLFLEN